MRRVVVDGNELDAGTGEAPALILNNPVFIDLKSIKLNRTTSYTLPATGRNLAVLGLVGDTPPGQGFPRSFHHLEEYRDGIPLIRDGRARIVSVTPGAITLSVTWGFPRDVKELLSRKLRELAPLRLPWTQATIWAGTRIIGNTPYGWLQYAVFDDGSEPEIEYTLPGIRLDELLARVGKDTGLTILLPGATSGFAAQAWVPCLSRQDDVDWDNPAWATIARARTRDIIAAVFNGGLVQFYSLGAPSWDFDRDDLQLKHEVVAIYPPESPVYSLAAGAGEYVVRVRVTFVPALENQGPVCVVIRVDDQEQAFREPYPHLGLSVSATFEVSIEKGGLSRVSAEWRDLNTGKVLHVASPEQGALIEVAIQLAPGDLEYNVPGKNSFNVTRNLPDMTCLDLLWTVCSMLGLYVTGDADGAAIRLNPTSDLVNRQASGVRVVDLDYRAISRQADSLSYSFSDYARENWFRYASDDSVGVVVDARLRVADDTLAASKDVVELPFAPCDVLLPGSPPVALVPVFEKDKESGEIEFNGDKLKPRIVMESVAPGTQPSVATFGEEMSWDRLLQYHELLSRLLASPRVVKLKIRVSRLSRKICGLCVNFCQSE